MINSKKKIALFVVTTIFCFSALQHPVFATSSISQWANGGTASTSYSLFEPEFAAGAPDADKCDDARAAWASDGEGDTVDWLAMEFDTSVYIEEINIYQNNIKGAISKVEVSADGIEWTQVYSGSVADWSWGSCDITDTTVFYDIFTLDDANAEFPDFAINKVKITVDQTIAEQWAEIDAVQLVGSESASANVRASATTKPSISGKAVSTKNGINKLTANKGTWIGTPAPTFTYKWYSCTAAVTKVKQTIPSSCKVISGETKKTLAVTTSLKNKFISVKVTGTSEGTDPTWYLSKSTDRVK